MDERELLLLGLLKAQSQHGYQINEFIERNLSRVTDLKKPTAYAILDRLGRSGYITVQTEQEGNRPPRKVYSMTDEGERVFFELLRTNVAQPEHYTFPINIGLMFIDQLPRDEIIQVLQKRREQLATQLKEYEKAPKHTYALGAQLSIEHIMAHMRLDMEWLQATIDQLQLTAKE